MIKDGPSHEKTHKLLDDILPKFDPTYNHSAIMETQMMETKIKKYMPFQDFVVCTIKNSGISGTSYFKIPFEDTLIQFVPNETYHLRTTIKSISFTKEDDEYSYAFTPSYIPNINHLTLRVSQNESELNEEITANKDFDAYNIFTYENNVPADVDTLNRFHKGYSKKQTDIEDAVIRTSIRKCFEFCYWNLPDTQKTGRVLNRNKHFGFIKPDQSSSENLYFSKSNLNQELEVGDLVEFEIGKNNKGPIAQNVKKISGSASRSIIHNFIYDRPKSIADIILVRKTIARIDEIDDKDRYIYTVDTDETRATGATVTFLADDGQKIVSQKQHVYITNNVANDLENGDVINCIMARTIHEQKKPLPFFNPTIIGSLGKIEKDLSPYIAVIIWKKLQSLGSDKSLCRVGELSEIHKELINILHILNVPQVDELKNPVSFQKFFDSSIENLFPIFVMHDNSLYHNPPALISHLAFYEPGALENKEMMGLIGALFDLLLNNYYEWGSSAHSKLRFSTQGEKLQKNYAEKIDFNRLISSLPKIANRIVLSRILSQNWKQWMSD